MTRTIHLDCGVKTGCGLFLTLKGARDRISLTLDPTKVTCEYCSRKKP